MTMNILPPCYMRGTRNPPIAPLSFVERHLVTHFCLLARQDLGDSQVTSLLHLPVAGMSCLSDSTGSVPILLPLNVSKAKHERHQAEGQTLLQVPARLASNVLHASGPSNSSDQEPLTFLPLDLILSEGWPWPIRCSRPWTSRQMPTPLHPGTMCCCRH